MKFKNAINYDKFANAQKFCAEILINELLIYKKDFNQIYEIGCGSGLLTNLIKSNLNYQNLILNDIYESSIMKTQSGEMAQIGDIMSLEMPLSLNLVISSSVFQWIDDLDLLCQKIHASLGNGGICAFATFMHGTLNELSEFTNQSLNYKTNEQIYEIFGKNFKILSSKNGKFIDKFANLKELLNSLKQTGVNNIKGNFKLTKSSLNALNSHFLNTYGEFRLSYKFAILICRKLK